MTRDWTDPETGIEYEIFWCPSMKVSLTGPRPLKNNPVWDSPAKATLEEKAKLNKPVPITWNVKDEEGGPSAGAVHKSIGGARTYNKTGKHAKSPDFWNTVKKDQDDTNTETAKGGNTPDE